MSSLIRRPALARVCAILATGLLACGVAGPALAATIIHFQRESLPALKRQLNADRIHAATFHPKSHVIHASLNDGQRMTVSYPASEQSAIEAQLRSRGVPVEVALPSAHKAKAVHHKLRYIAGGVLIVVILVVLAVLLLGRNRTLAGDGDPAAGEGDSSASEGATS
jgi:hypothetical protein